MSYELYLDPAEQLLVLLDSCDNDIDEAVCCARTRAMNAAIDDDKEFLFWMQVLRMIPRSDQQLMVMAAGAIGEC